VGILDSIQDGVNKGLDGAGRATKKVQLNSQLNDIDKQRERLLAQLGSSLFLETRTNPNFRAPREQIYAGIESLDARRSGIQNEIALLEQVAQPVAVQTPSMQQPPQIAPYPGLEQSPPQPQVVATAFEPAQVAFCTNCGAPLAPIARFCTACGSTVDE
jgi:hypothetical protein